MGLGKSKHSRWPERKKGRKEKKGGGEGRGEVGRGGEERRGERKEERKEGQLVLGLTIALCPHPSSYG